MDNNFLGFKKFSADTPAVIFTKLGLISQLGYFNLYDGQKGF